MTVIVPMEIQIPLFEGRTVIVSGEFPIPRRDWDQLLSVLDAMSPALASLPAEPSND